LTDTQSAWTTEGYGGITTRVRARLERTAREVAAEWDVALGPPLRFARYSFVAPAGRDMVLKVVPVEDDEADHEPDALALWDGEGAVRLVRHDRARRAMLLERARPATDAAKLPEEQARKIALTVAPKLWRPAPPGGPFRWIGDEVRRWLANAPEHPVVRRAREVFATMRVGSETVVHGDFHHYNLVCHADRWVAIDPKPYVGEPEYDVPTLLWNPLEHVPTPDAAERWISAFAAIGLDAERIREWTLVRGSYLAFPLAAGETEETSRQLRAARLFL
jgi:streptomycin 6-kinase